MYSTIFEVEVKYNKMILLFNLGLLIYLFIYLPFFFLFGPEAEMDGV